MVAVVTGGHGFLGSHIADRLTESGWDAVPVGRPDVEIPSPEFGRLAAEVAPALVVHCAGPASVADSIRDPQRDFDGSAGVLTGLLGQLKDLSPPPRVLVISSAAVYGQPDSLPIGEEAPPAPVSPYGQHRLACEQLLREFHQLHGVPCTIVRVFSSYGEGLRRQIMWDICRQALESGAVELSGTGNESRDFIHAVDVAGAIDSVARQGVFEAEAYNVACGRETTIAELAAVLLRALDLDPGAVAFDGIARSGDPTNWLADTSRLKGLGFSPSVAIEDGAARYAKWAREALKARSEPQATQR